MVQLTRTQTLLGGASHCDCRYPGGLAYPADWTGSGFHYIGTRAHRSRLEEQRAGGCRRTRPAEQRADGVTWYRPGRPVKPHVRPHSPNSRRRRSPNACAQDRPDDAGGSTLGCPGP
jgi:hypothetical protein